MPHRPSVHGPRTDGFPRISRWNGTSYAYQSEYRSFCHCPHAGLGTPRKETALRLSTRRGFSLVNDSGSSRGDDHTSIARPYLFHTEPSLPSHQSFYSAQPSKSHFSRYSRFPISHEPLLVRLKSIVPNKIQPFFSLRPFSSSYLPPAIRSSDSSSLLPGEKEQGEFRRQIETPQSLPSAQTYSCIPPSLSGNQNGPTSYLPCRATSSISVYVSQTDESADPTASRLTGAPGDHLFPGYPHNLATSPTSSLSNQELLRHAAHLLRATSPN